MRKTGIVKSFIKRRDGHHLLVVEVEDGAHRRVTVTSTGTHEIGDRVKLEGAGNAYVLLL